MRVKESVKTEMRIEGSNYQLSKVKILQWINLYDTDEGNLGEEALIVNTGREAVTIGTGDYLVTVRLS